MFALVTFTATAHEPLTAIVPPLSETLFDPAVAVAVPPHELVRAGELATTTLAGKVSLTATPVRACVLALGLARVMVRVLTPLG